MRKAAIAYSRVYAKKMMSEKNQEMVNLTAKALMECLSTKDIELSFRRMLAETLEYLLLYDKNAIRLDITNYCIKFLD